MGMALVGIVAFAALVVAVRALKRLQQLQEEDERKTRALHELALRVVMLEKGGAPAKAGAPVEPAPKAEPAPVRPAPQPTPSAAPSMPPPPRVPAPPPVPPPPPVGAPTFPPPGAERPAPPPRPEQTATPTPPPPPPPPPPRRPWRPPTPPVSIDWEGLVGVKLFSWIAGVALVLAAVFFLRYSIEHGWLSDSVKMAIGLAVGVGLLVACEMRAARRYAVTANAMDAAGIAVLFMTFFAAHARWHLVPQVPTFVLMALVTAVAVALSIRRNSLFIAILGLLGGFLTPALLSTGENRPVSLFSYLLLLNVGLAWVAHQKRWAVLTAVSAVLTVVYQWAWVLKFLHGSSLSLAMAIFLVFPVLQMGTLLLAESREGETDPLFGHTARTAAILPLLFAVYLAAVPAYGAHVGLLFGFVLLIGAGLATVAIFRGPPLVHLVGGAGVVAAFAVWCGMSYTSAAWPQVLVWVSLAVALYLAAPAVAAWFARSLGDEGHASRLVAPALLFVFPFLAVHEPSVASPGLLFGVLLGLLALVAAVAVTTEHGALHFLAAFFAVVAQAAWSARHLAPERLYAGLLVFGAFGLFYIAVPLLAARAKKRLDPGPASALVLLASTALVLFLAAGPVARVALAGIGALLALLNLGLLSVVASGPWRILRVAGVLVSWLVLAVWWATAMTATLLLPALVVVAGFALLVVASNAWTATHEARRDDTAVYGIGLALVAHLFLVRIAVQPGLAIPPWPLFGVLGVLDLAIATAALAVRDGRPHLAAIVLSQLVVTVWSVVAHTTPWPLVAIAASDGLVVLAFIWITLAERRRGPVAAFAQAAVGAVLLAQVIAILAAEADGAPTVVWLVGQHVVLLATLLTVAARMGWWILALVGVAPTAFASILWVAGHVEPETWFESFVFAAAPYLVFVANASLVRRRAGTSAFPYLAATLSGIVFLGLARRCLIVGGWESWVGFVAVAQAAATLLLLRELLAERTIPLEADGRVALVAATALGFATAAIPLQLSRQWITVAWALETAALAALYRRIRFPQIRWWVAGLAVAVFVRLALNREIFSYYPRADTAIWNWYLYTYLVSAVAFFAAAWLLRPTEDRVVAGLPRISTLLPAGATILLFLLLNIEIADFYSEGMTLAFNFFSSSLAQDLTYTLGWAAFAIALLIVGIRLESHGARITALGLLVLTIVKAFLHDLWRLGGLYRVGSFVGLAICLSLVAILLQRFAFVPKEEAS